jgi:hypothetical protein
MKKGSMVLMSGLFAAGVFVTRAHAFGGSPSTFSATVPDGWIIEKKIAESMRKDLAQYKITTVESYSDPDGLVALSLFYGEFDGGGELSALIKGVRNGLGSVAQESEFHVNQQGKMTVCSYRGMANGTSVSVQSRWLAATDLDGVHHFVLAQCALSPEAKPASVNECKRAVANATLNLAPEQQKQPKKVRKSGTFNATTIGFIVGFVLVIVVVLMRRKSAD